MDGKGLNPDGYSLIEEMILILGCVVGIGLVDFPRILVLGVGGSRWRDGMVGIWTSSVAMNATIYRDFLKPIEGKCLFALLGKKQWWSRGGRRARLSKAAERTDSPIGES